MAKLVKRDKGELEKIKQVQNFSDEQIKLFCDFAQLRHETHIKMEQDLAKRQAVDQKASEQELDLGAYIEQIEPQVRETVLELRQKGYTTHTSGFSGFDSQKISFTEEHLKNYTIPPSLSEEFEKIDANIIVEPRSIEIKFGRYHDLDEIRILWKKVAASLPSLGGPARPNQIRSGKMFREKHS
jgi:hypothetical protein